MDMVMQSLLQDMLEHTSWVGCLDTHLGQMFFSDADRSFTEKPLNCSWVLPSEDTTEVKACVPYLWNLHNSCRAEKGEYATQGYWTVENPQDKQFTGGNTLSTQKIFKSYQIYIEPICWTDTQL